MNDRAALLTPTWRDRVTGGRTLSPVAFDAVLFGLSALFAAVVTFGSKIPLYRQWGQLAVIPYLLATLAALGLVLVARRRSVMGWRIALSALVFIGAVVVPMAGEVAWRFEVSPQSLHVQPEVTVVERAATVLGHGHDPYQARMVAGVLQGRVASLPAYEAFFPYLPAMTVFGLPAATGLPKELTDARILFVLCTLACVIAGLLVLAVDPSRRLRAAQVAVVLPWAALAMATGGDDLPIVGLLLVAVVLAQRRRPGWAGIVLGLASAMKFTAWPLALLLLYAASDREGRRAPGRMLAGILVVVAPLVAVFAAWDPATFLANVVAFPLGLSGVASPAGSALPGHIFVSHFPALHHAYTAAAVAAGAVGLGLYLWRRPPRGTAKVCQVAGTTLLVAIMLAPATRIGYLLYPLNLFVWSWMLSPPEPEPLEVRPAIVSLEA
jgi:hypothetical protein